MDKYFILRPNHGAGMFSFVWETLKMIKHFNGSKFYIDFSESIYRKKMNDNAWDYFFEQPFIQEFPKIEEIERVIFSQFNFDQPEHIKYANEYIFEFMDQEDISNRKLEYNKIIKQYLKLKPFMQEKIDNFYNHNFKGKKVLSCHFRGTDHPYKISTDKAIQIISNFIDNFDILFISSDELNKVNTIKQHFGEKVVDYNGRRSLSERPLHNSRYLPSEDTYKCGEDVIVESYLHSNADFMICLPGSNVNYFSRYLNPNLKSITYLSEQMKKDYPHFENVEYTYN